ncbi:glycosyltransferase [Baekduia soli]|uniref:Glycosyltransferase n=1 Tax=Baekduia soli TaxID=496014 RepID=A0A5B8TZV1_9ACTN|nr:glycosyltransferase [Baekduia soli]QEC46253.1 glycosyltransferase [Baekduia soli]
MRICLVYDCLYPWTVGGAERWMRALAEGLAARGHEVTYLTRRQWADDEQPEVPGVRIVAVSPRAELYGEGGARALGPPVRFGAGVLRHLLEHGKDYDIVHTSLSPFFSVLGAGLARRLRRRPPPLFVDWFEVWTLAYCRQYYGTVTGTIGWFVQHLCARTPQHAFVYNRVHTRRLVAEGLRGDTTLVRGLYTGTVVPHGTPAQDPPLVLFAGRHIPEKGVLSIPPAIAAAREQVGDLRALVVGDGSQRPELLAMIERLGLGDVIEAPGFVDGRTLEEAMGRAACLLLPSSREGYGMVVIEAAGTGTPSVVVAGDDNAAVELIAEGENGFVAASREPADLAAALVAVVRGGPELRRRTAAWFAREAPELAVGTSVQKVLAAYERVLAAR